MEKSAVITISVQDENSKLFLQLLSQIIYDNQPVQKQVNDRVSKTIKNTPIPAHYEYVRPKNKKIPKRPKDHLYPKHQIGHSFKKF